MKKILRFLIIFIMLMPILLYASTYQQSKISAKRFIHRDYSDTYQRYLIDADRVGTLPWSNNSNDNEAYTNGDTAFGGMLTKIEYENSRGDAPRSYLFDGKQYWSMTAEGEGHYVIGLNAGLSDSNSTPATKVTEYVQHSTKITGRGTIDEPWVFVPKYSLTVTGENGTVKPVGGRVGDAAVVNGVNDEVTFELTPDSGNNYLYNTCGLITTPSTTKEINDTGKITFSGINKDIACKIVFGKGLFELNIEQINQTSPDYLKTELRTDPQTLYVRNSEQFYSDMNGNTPITKFSTFVAEKLGHTFEGLYYDMPTGGRIKVVDASGNIDRLAAKNITSNGSLEPEFTPLVIRTTLNGNGGKFGTSETTTVDFTYGEPYGDFATPLYYGYDFTGWYKQASGGTPINTSDIFHETYNVPLYAHWAAKNVIVSFNGNGGTVNITSTNVTFNNNYGTLATATRRGYTFDGWKASDGTTITASTKVTNASNHELTAQWTIQRFTCAAGKYLKKDSLSCDTCIAGYSCPGGTYPYNPTTDQGITKCPAGTYSAAGASSCKNCGAGKYSPAGATSCSNCPSSCSTCTSATVCTSCKAGYYKNGNSCTACGAGRFQPSNNSTATSCTKCAKGSIPNSNKTGCTACQPSGAAGSNGTTTAAGASSCNASCGKSNVSSWKTASWSNNSVSNSCTINSCKSGYKKSGSSCIKATVNCRKKVKDCSDPDYSTDACSVDPSRMNLCENWGGYAESYDGYNCLGQAATYYHCNWYDGCGCHGGGVYAFECGTKWDYKNNVTKCPSGYEQY